MQPGICLSLVLVLELFKSESMYNLFTADAEQMQMFWRSDRQ